MNAPKSSLEKRIRNRELHIFYERPIARLSAQLFLTYAAIIFFSIVAIRPTLQTMAQLLKEIEEKRALDTRLSQKINALTSLQRQLSEKEYILPVLQAAIPNNPKFTEFLTVIEKLSSERSVILTSAQVEKSIIAEQNPDTQKPPTELTTYPIHLTVEGSYENLFAFIQDLSNMRRICLIDQFDILPASSQDSNSLVLSMDVRIFSFQEKSL